MYFLLQTDLKNTDYTLEAGATRLFEAEKLAKEMAERERQAIEDEELNNPMKVWLFIIFQLNVEKTTVYMYLLIKLAIGNMFNNMAILIIHMF